MIEKKKNTSILQDLQNQIFGKKKNLIWWVFIKTQQICHS